MSEHTTTQPNCISIDVHLTLTLVLACEAFYWQRNKEIRWGEVLPWISTTQIVYFAYKRRNLKLQKVETIHLNGVSLFLIFIAKYRQMKTIHHSVAAICSLNAFLIANKILSFSFPFSLLWSLGLFTLLWLRFAL